VSDYGLDDRATEVRIPAEAKDFSSSPCPNWLWAHPDSCPVGTGGLYPGGKRRPGRDADHTPHMTDYDGVRLTSQKRGHDWLIVQTRVHVTGEPWWWWSHLGITPDLPTRALSQSYQQRHLERVRGVDEGLRILFIQYLWYVNGSFTYRKILGHGASGFTSHPKEGVLWTFSPLKIHRLGRV
jgi:hypothetical protein